VTTYCTWALVVTTPAPGNDQRLVSRIIPFGFIISSAQKRDVVEVNGAAIEGAG